jgi:hypothetical protein
VQPTNAGRGAFDFTLVQSAGGQDEFAIAELLSQRDARLVNHAAACRVGGSIDSVGICGTISFSDELQEIVPRSIHNASGLYQTLT